MTGDWRDELEGWLAPFLAALRHKTRARMCPAYVAGLIGPGDRKSVQPMAARADDISYDQLHHFVASGLWDAAPLETELLSRADALVGGDDAWLIIDDSAATPDPGDHGASVAKEGHPLSRCCTTICFDTGEERQLPDACLADTGVA